MNSAQNIIELNNVTKLYGKAVGVKDVNLQVPKGTVFGFLGPNGAGKTTTISLLINLLKPTQGKIKIFGLDSSKDNVAIKKKVGYLTDDMALDKRLNGWQQLEYFSHLQGGFHKKIINKLAQRLDCSLDKNFNSLSRGNRQKIGLIASLMHSPDLLIFDEPTSGLDPLIQAEFNKIILEQKRRGATVFISSHVLNEVQEICDHVAFIRDGQVIASQPMRDAIASSTRHVRVGGATKTFAKTVAGLKTVSNSKYIRGRLNFDYSGNPNQLVKILSTQKLGDLTIKEPDLDDVFMKFYEDRNV